MSVQQQRINKGDANDGDSVSQAEQGQPLFVAEPEQLVQCEDQIARMPATNAERQHEEYSFKWRQFASMSKE